MTRTTRNIMPIEIHLHSTDPKIQSGLTSGVDKMRTLTYGTYKTSHTEVMRHSVQHQQHKALQT